MLETAFQCFQGASRCEGDSDEEEWLIHYMLGKIAEKRRQPPAGYLQLYKKVKWFGDRKLDQWFSHFVKIFLKYKSLTFNTIHQCSIRKSYHHIFPWFCPTKVAYPTV